MKKYTFRVGAFVMALGLVSGSSFANASASDSLPAPSGGGSGQAVAMAKVGLGIPMASDRLQASRGGFVLIKNDTQLTADVTGNTADHVVTGWNVLSGGSFANMSGLATVIQNSGANVSIQNATNINILMSQ